MLNIEDLKAGSKITIDENVCGDIDLLNWLAEKEENGENTVLTITSIELENGMCWVEDCSYGIQLNEIYIEEI